MFSSVQVTSLTVHEPMTRGSGASAAPVPHVNNSDLCRMSCRGNIPLILTWLIALTGSRRHLVVGFPYNACRCKFKCCFVLCVFENDLNINGNYILVNDHVQFIF